jgi:hypothetical protein
MDRERPLEAQLTTILVYARRPERRAWLCDALSVGAETQGFVDDDLRWVELGERVYVALAG